MRFSRKSRFLCGVSIAIALCLSTSGAAMGAAPAAAVDGPALVEKIAKRVGAIEDEFPGNYSRRQIVRKILDPDDGSLRKTWEIEADVWDFQGQQQQMKILGCRLDGKKTDLGDCEPDLQGDPMLRVFGPDRKKNYKVTYAGDTVIGGVPAHRIEIAAREKTARHFEGQMYFAVDSLQVVRVVGGLAKYPFGLKKLALELDFGKVGDASMIQKGTSDLTIYVPLLYNERLVTSFTATDQKRLTAAQRPKD